MSESSESLFPEIEDKSFRLIVAGTRWDIHDYDRVTEVLDNLLQHKCKTHEIEIVSGNANGADKLGELYAKANGYPVKCFPADWKKHARAAGPIRNGEMARYAHALCAFWDGNSRGTKNMIEQAEKHGLMVRVIDV